MAAGVIRKGNNTPQHPVAEDIMSHFSARANSDTHTHTHSDEFMITYVENNSHPFCAHTRKVNGSSSHHALVLLQMCISSYIRVKLILHHLGKYEYFAFLPKMSFTHATLLLMFHYKLKKHDVINTSHCESFMNLSWTASFNIQVFFKCFCKLWSV